MLHVLARRRERYLAGRWIGAFVTGEVRGVKAWHDHGVRT